VPWFNGVTFIIGVSMVLLQIVPDTDILLQTVLSVMVKRTQLEAEKRKKKDLEEKQD
jgi:hypothetical protein